MVGRGRGGLESALVLKTSLDVYRRKNQVGVVRMSVDVGGPYVISEVVIL